MRPLFSTLFVSLFTILILPVHAQQDTLKLNQLQVIGSHNSYKRAIEPDLFKFIQAKDSSKSLNSLQYEHLSITEQLNLGLRNLEVDVLADSKGGKYAKPKGLEMVKAAHPYDVEGLMSKPGFKVLHIPDLDFRSSVPTLIAYLKALKTWSDQHPDHIPVFMTLEPKGGETNSFGTSPEAFTAALFDELDSCIREHLGESKLITPDLVRGSYPTLEEAVLHGNWPQLKLARGKFFFLLDDNGRSQELYKQGHPSLKGRVIFINAKPGSPEAAAIFRNDPDDPEIPELVKKGYLIRTRADADTKEARANDYSRFIKAQQSGAQIITTDYYRPSTFFKSSYQVQFKDGSYVRVNPVAEK